MLSVTRWALSLLSRGQFITEGLGFSLLPAGMLML